MTTNKTGEHTAGPWTASRSDYDWYVEYYNDGRQRTVTKLSAQGIGLDRAEANARLIAASPELLWALRNLLDALGATTNPTKLFGYIGKVDAKRTFAALAAATGGTP